MNRVINVQQPTPTPTQVIGTGDVASWQEVARRLLARWKQISGSALLVAAATYGITLLLAPTYTAKMSFLSPQPQQSAATAALAALGNLSGLAGGNATRSSSDQYVSLMQSVTVSNEIVEKFNLQDVYKTKFKEDARKDLKRHVRIVAGKKDGLISVEVDDVDPRRAADMANAYFSALTDFSNSLALTEAQQRRSFFQKQLKQTRDLLGAAQDKLTAAGFNSGTLKAEPKATAEAFARVKAEIAANEIRLQTALRTLTEQAVEVQQLRAANNELNVQLRRFEKPMEGSANQDYVLAYREVKYQEAMFDIYARQFELARLDEAKEGTLFQVVDKATPPERRSAPQRTKIALSAMLLAVLALCAFFGRKPVSARGQY